MPFPNPVCIGRSIDDVKVGEGDRPAPLLEQNAKSRDRIAAWVAGENTDASDSGLRAALDVLRGQDPVAQMKPLAELVRQIQETIAPLAKAAP